MKRIVITFFLVITLSGLLAACGDGKSTPEQSARLPAMSVGDILSRAKLEINQTNSLRLELEHNKKGFTYIAMDIQMEKLVADLQRPDRMRGFISGTYGRAYLKNMGLIIVGDISYLRVIGDNWFALKTTVKPIGFLDTIGAIAGEITGPQRLPDEEKDGVLSYHLRGQVNAEHLRAFVGSDVTRETVDIDLWVGGQDFLVREVAVRGKLTSREDPGITRIIKLSNFGQQVNIEPPLKE